MYIKVNMLKTHQLRTTLQLLFLPFFETSKETRQKASEHTLHLSQTGVPGQVPSLRFTLTPFPRPLPALEAGSPASWQLSLLPQSNYSLSFEEAPVLPDPAALAPHNPLPGLRRQQARRAPESLCRGRQSQLSGHSPPCRGRAGKRASSPAPQQRPPVLPRPSFGP